MNQGELIAVFLSLIGDFLNSSCVFYLELLYYCLGDLVVRESVEVFSRGFSVCRCYFV